MKNRVREWREAAGLTQDQLAKRIGADKSLISKIETGERSLGFKWTHHIAKALDVKPADLIGQADASKLNVEEFSSSTTDKRNLWFLSHMNPDGVPAEITYGLPTFMNFMRQEEYDGAITTLEFLLVLVKKRRADTTREVLREWKELSDEYSSGKLRETVDGSSFYDVIFNLAISYHLDIADLGLPTIEEIKANPSLWPSAAKVIFSGVAERMEQAIKDDTKQLGDGR